MFFVQGGVPPDRASTSYDTLQESYVTRYFWNRLPGVQVSVLDGRAYCGAFEKFREGVDLNQFPALVAKIMRALE